MISLRYSSLGLLVKVLESPVVMPVDFIHLLEMAQAMTTGEPFTVFAVAGAVGDGTVWIFLFGLGQRLKTTLHEAFSGHI